ncbi:helix-turn-helix domain-containing protein [Nonomuraea sp. NPDC051941]|uniref:helix-turn-helix domain-containing protein n=1 Tax=Nonomuraea sp. NPDC051941 TaxID=3364373 RepID=UPI0037C92690
MSDSPQTTEDRRAEAVRLYASGLTVRQVAAELKVSHAAVHRALVAANVPRRPRGSTASLLSPQRRAQILAAYRSGMPIEDMMRSLRVCGRTIKSVAEEAGEPPRERGGPRSLDWDQIAGLADQGWPSDAIAVLVGGSIGHVRAILRDMGYGRGLAELPESPELVELYQRLKSVRAVARHLRAGPRRVKDALAAAGVDTTRSFRQPRAA